MEGTREWYQVGLVLLTSQKESVTLRQAEFRVGDIEWFCQAQVQIRSHKTLKHRALA